MHIPFADMATRRVASMAAARAARAERNRLRAELDSYRTPAEKAELGAVLGRSTAEQLDLLVARSGRREYAA